MEMRLIDFLKMNGLIVEYGVRFFVTGEGSVNTGEPGANQPFYCHLREKKTTSTVDEYTQSFRGGITGNGDTLMQAMMNLILKLEELGRKKAEIGTENRRFIMHVTRLDTGGIKWP